MRTLKIGIIATLLLVVTVVFAQTPMRPPPTPKTPAEVNQALSKQAAIKENCDQYYENAKDYLENFRNARSALQETASATISTAYSLLYQNCLARNKR